MCFSNFLVSQNWMGVLKCLILFERSLSLREFVDYLEMSPAGVRDILRRLKEFNVIKEKREKNKCFYELHLNEVDKAFLKNVINKQSIQHIKQRVPEFSSRVSAAYSWNDESIKLINYARNSASSSS